MLKALANSWKTLVFKGILMVILAIISFSMPAATAASIVIWIAALIVLDGIITLVTAISEWKTREDRWRFVLEGVLSLAFGLILLFTPGITLLFIGLMISFWFILTGINRIVMGIRLRKEIEGEGWIIFNGVLAVLIGGIIAAQPYVGITSLIWLLGFGFLLGGIALITLGLKFRKGKHKISEKFEELRDDLKSGS
ncbi:HdeD family acid-resistance protein [Robertkochia aurantiaca]|uniref:HdeD family acid-resistance protein n=1 Tax=Robertkochia aurantiaca TaxID=2873700 RepID=UPI001CCFB567|nr:HdeD family acid-resistance protein [Robertkochia sp. 3YJGBD-33]